MGVQDFAMEAEWEKELRLAGCGLPAQGADSEADFDYNTVTPEQALFEAGNFLIELKLESKLDAVQACTLAWWIWKAGLGGEFQKLAVEPDTQSGKFSDHFDNVVGTKPKDLCDDFSTQNTCVQTKRSKARDGRHSDVFSSGSY